MVDSNQRRMQERLDQIGRSLEKLSKSLESVVVVLNEANRLAHEKFVWLKQSAAMEEMDVFTPDDPRTTQKRYDVGTEVVVWKEDHVRCGWVGMVEKIHQSTIAVKFEDDVISYFGSGSDLLPMSEVRDYLNGITPRVAQIDEIAESRLSNLWDKDVEREHIEDSSQDELWKKVTEFTAISDTVRDERSTEAPDGA